MEESVRILNSLFDRYHISNKDRYIIYEYIKNIFKHDEFQKRLKPVFYHHGETLLGEHILQDTIMTYILCKKEKKK